MKQLNGRIWFGMLKVVLTRVSGYFSYINFFMLLLTFYSVAGYKYASLDIYIVGAVGTISVLGIIDYAIIMPSEIAFNNQQIAKHQNPIYNEIVDIKNIITQEDDADGLR